MAGDSTQQGTTQQQDTQQGQPADTRSQVEFDTSFIQQVSGQQLGQQIDWAREYVESIQQQVHTLRRVTELAALNAQRQQIVSEAAQLAYRQVMGELGRSSSRRA